MNANSRRILERKQQRNTESADHQGSTQIANAEVNIINGQIIKQQTRLTAAATRKTTKSVPTGTLDLSMSKKNTEENRSSFAPKLNKKSIQMTQAKR